MAETSTQPAAPEIHGYAVSEACITCDACCDDFPEVFKMNADHTRAIPVSEIKSGVYDPWDVIYDCPVDAISLIKGTLPPPPEGKKKKTVEEVLPDPADILDDRPWRVRWEEAKGRGEESYWDRMKRYGMAATVEEMPQQYLLRLALPEKVPDHPFKFNLKFNYNPQEKILDVIIDKNLS